MKYLLILLAALGLAACGGGGSSSTTPTGTVYTGGQEATLTGNGVSVPVTNIPFRMVITDGTSVFITDTANPPVEATGTVSGNSFTATSNSSATVDGVTCTFDWTYTGTISGNTVSGTITGPVTCSSGGVTLTLTTSNGSFAGTLSSSSKAPIGDGLLKSVADAVN